jgi:hypothetical protein
LRDQEAVVLRHGARVRVRELRAAGDVVDDPAVVSAADPTKRQVRAFGCCRTCRHPSLTHSLTGRRRVPQPGAFSRRNLQLLNSERFDGLARLALISPHQLRLKNDKIQSPLQQQYLHHLPVK